jgi:hypothetical protein
MNAVDRNGFNVYNLKLTTLGPVKSGHSCYETSLLKTIAIYKTLGRFFTKVFDGYVL